MNCKENWLLIICFTLLTQHSLAQQGEINFTSLTTVDGLSSNTVNTILKDRYGMIWFGTEDGLDRFDGTRFTVYRHQPNDPSSLSANEILSLYEDVEGNLWIGTSGGSLNLYDREYDRFIGFPSSGNTKSIHNNVIRNVCSDLTGKIWIAHYAGVNILDPRSMQVSDLLLSAGDSSKIFNKTTNCLYGDGSGHMWLGTTEGLFRYNFLNKTFLQFSHSDKDSGSISGNQINAICQDKKGNLWIGTENGLSRLEAGTNKFVNFRHSDKNSQTLSNSFVNSIAVDADKLWVGTAEGLNVIDITTYSISRFTTDQRKIHSLSSSAVKCIYIDKQGIYWLGTIRGGVNKYDKNLNLFNYVRSNGFDDKGLNAPMVTSFSEKEGGKIFVGTDDGGLSLFDVSTRLFHRYDIRSRNRKDNRLPIIFMLMSSNNKLLIGTASEGLFVLDPVSGKYEQILKGPNPDHLNSNDIYCIAELRNGNIVVGTNGDGINILNKNFKVISRFTPHPKMPNDSLLPFNGYIRDIKEAKNGNIWIATHGGGLGVLKMDSHQFVNFTTYNSKLPNDKVQCLLEDSDGFIWAGTFGGGIVRMNNTGNNFDLYSENEGLQNSNVYKIIEDNKKLIWVSTNTGVSSLDVNSKKINNYTYHNGLQHNNFVRGSGIQLADGTILFGGLDGFNYFHPANLIKNNNIPPVLLTGLRVSNQYVTASEDGILNEHISLAKEIRLDYKQNFSLDYVGLSYTSPEQNQYAYKLESFDKEWNYVGNVTSAGYTNLDPGDYVFRVRASNNDGVWNNEGTSIKIHVQTPLWMSGYAYATYLLLLLGILIYIRHLGIRKIHRKFELEQHRNEEEQKQREAAKTHELDSQKIKFLTNLSHEFRTPISLILGPVDSLLEKEHNIKSFRQLDMIKRNGRRLLNLVNQLLDFRKMEEHELKLHLEEGELVSFIKEVADSFKDLAERKEMNFVYVSQVDKLHVLFDHDKLERVLFNVLSNAFKFTKPGGSIMLDIKKSGDDPEQLKTLVEIIISDNGIGIPLDKKEKIFNLFYQNDTGASILNQGSGIGLTITKEFVKMHGGTINVESEPERGTSFEIIFSFTNCSAPGITEVASPSTAAGPGSIKNANQILENHEDASIHDIETPSVLLVEDNEDFRLYMKDKLMLQYKVIEAVNGIDGWKKALALHPQLIISDVSMPEMDGIDLCRKIKTDKRTSHIPIILLTARVGEEAQLEGLKTGANDYIIKPFHLEVLTEKIKNLLVLNNTLKLIYGKQFKPAAPQVQVESADEKLLNSIMAYLEENLSNPQLSVYELSRHLAVSRSSLYAKLLELTGQTPVEYIRTIKLAKAAVLLEKSDLNIAEVAYSTGFSAPNYFAKSFKAKYGMLPSEYIVKMRLGGKKNGTV